MTSKDKNDDPPSTKRSVEMKLRRREIYILVSAEKRETQLLQCRTNNQQLKRNTISAAVAFPVHDHCAANVQGYGSTSQNPHQMEFLTVSAIIANELHHAALPVTVDKQNNIVTPLCVYEVGSTSGTSNSKCNMASSIIQNKAHRQHKTSWININQLQSDYVHLKIVPNCKFCGAKRFEYESPGFCCNNGSIKLISNQNPMIMLFVPSYLILIHNNICGHLFACI